MDGAVDHVELLFAGEPDEVDRVSGGSRPTWTPLISSRPPLIAYSSVLARLTRAPKNCICLPTSIAETQHAIAVSSPHRARSRSSDSYWIELVSMETCAQNRLNPSGSAGDHSTVRFGSGAAPRLYSVCR